MKPLLCMVTYNRLEETRRTLCSLFNTTSLKDVEFHLVDNGSTEEGMIDFLKSLDNTTLHFQSNNIGCPRALNIVMSFRKPNQDFIKIDNDTEIKTPNWLGKWMDLLNDEPDLVLIGGYYKKAFNCFQEWHTSTNGIRWASVWPIIGHFVLHKGTFLDKVGYFGVLDENHVYGFEDLLMCHKAKLLGKLRLFQFLNSPKTTNSPRFL